MYSAGPGTSDRIYIQVSPSAIDACNYTALWTTPGYDVSRKGSCPINDIHESSSTRPRGK